MSVVSSARAWSRKGKPSRLSGVAEQLRTETEATGKSARTRLANGLEISLLHRQSRWRLQLAREEDFPTAPEVALCCGVFDVPEAAGRCRRYVTRLHPKSRRPVRLAVVELTWTER